MTKIIVISSLKGGVGKTTTVLNLAGLYSALHQKVLMIDFDLVAGGLDIYLNIKPKHNLFDFNEDLENHKTIDLNQYIIKYNDNISLLATDHNYRQFNLAYLDSMLNCLRGMYDVILIDTNHALMDFNIRLFDLADKLLFMVTNDPIAITNTHNLLLLTKEAQITNYYLVLNETIPNRHYYDLHDLRQLLGHNIDYTIPASFYLKDIDKYIMRGHILTLEPTIIRKYSEAINHLLLLAKALIGE